MHKNSRRAQILLASLVGLILSAFAPCLSASAASNVQHVTISPSSTQLSVAPGGTINGNFNIYNQGTGSFSVAISASPYHVEGTGYDPQFTNLPGTEDSSRWVDLDKTAVNVLNPGKLTEVHYSVHVPVGTQPGGYYAVLFAETTPTDAGTGVVAHNRVGDILYITVSGPVKKSGEVLAGKLSRIATSNPVPISVFVHNTGGVHFVTSTTIDVANIFGKNVFHAALDHYVLPQTSREISVDWQAKAPIGLYKVSRSSTVPSGTVTLQNRWILFVQPWVIVTLVSILALIAATLIRPKVRKKR